MKPLMVERKHKMQLNNNKCIMNEKQK